LDLERADENREKAGSLTGPHRFPMEGWISCAPFERLLHMEIVRAAEGKATLEMPFLLDLAQGAGLMHGGALVSLADTAVVMAIKSLIPPETHFATTSLEAKFLHPVKKGMVTAEAEVFRQEGRDLEGRATVYDGEGRAVLTFTSHFKIAKDAAIRGVTFRNPEGK
jgi:acyl-CoA thioesterase